MTRKPASPSHAAATGSPGARGPLLASVTDMAANWDATKCKAVMADPKSSAPMKAAAKKRMAALGVDASMQPPDGMSIEDVLDAVRCAVREKYPMGMCYVEATDGSTVVVDCGSDGMFRHDWTIAADGTVTLSMTPEKVVEKTTYEPVSASLRVSVLGSNSKRVLSVRLIKTGMNEGREADGTRWNVPAKKETLASAVKTFGGARVHWHKAPDGTFEHTEKFGFAKTLTDWAGTSHDAGYLKDVEAKQDGVYASLVLDPDVPEPICASLAAGDLGLSVECLADREYRVEGGQRIADLVSFSHYANKQATVAIVSAPALGGNVLGLAASIAKHCTRAPIAASTRSTPMNLAEARALLASTDPTVTQAQRDAAQIVVDKAEAAELRASAKQHLDETKKMADETKAELAASRAANRKRELDRQLTESKLPDANCGVIRDLLASRIDAGTEVKDETIAAEIKRQREILGSVATGRGSPAVEVGAGPKEKARLGLIRLLMGDNAPKYAVDRVALLDPTAKGQVLASREQAAGIGYGSRASSYRRLFRECTGTDLEDVFRSSGSRRREIAASINVAAFGDVFENVLNIVGLAYQEDPNWSDWRRIVNVVPITGTLKQERPVVGGYADLPTVVEGENYPAAATPADQGHGYTPIKAGYTEDWTLEAQLNDRIGALQSIVRKMSIAADRTRYKRVFDPLAQASMPTMDYDSVALFHATSHGGNLLSSALTATSLSAARLVMRKQVDLASSQVLGIEPAFLLVPVDLEETAFNILKPKAEEPGGLTSERAWIRQMNLQIIAVRHWTDTNDFTICADPNNGLVPTMEVGFEGGRENAEIFVSDMGNVGSVFERDAVTVAVKLPYMGVAPLRHEGFVCSQT